MVSQTPGRLLYGTVFSKFLALLYKNLLLRKCHYIGTSFEVILPVIIASMPCIMYNGLTRIISQKRSESKWVNFTTYEPIVASKYIGIATDTLEFVYAPSNEVTDEFMKDSIRAFLPRTYGNLLKIPKRMNSEEEMKKYILEEQKQDERKVIIGTVFKGFEETLPEDLDYKIYYTGTFGTRNKYELNDPGNYYAYASYSFFIRWQTAVGDTFIKKKSTEYNRSIDYQIFLQTFPYPEHKWWNFSGTFDALFFLHVGLLFFASVIVKRIIEEKTDGLSELMETMRMARSPYWSSTFVNNFITAFIVILVTTIVYKTSLKNTFFQMQSDVLLLLFILMLLMASLILFCMAFSIFFNHVALAVCVLIIVQFLSYRLLMATMVTYPPLEEYFSLSLFHKLCICLFPSGALVTSLSLIHYLEVSNEGVQWHNLTEYPMVPDINMLMVIATMVFSCFFYTFAIWYFDAVWPWQPGKRRPFYFFLKRSHWFDEVPACADEIELVGNENSVDNLEKNPKNTAGSVIIRNLSKVISKRNSSKTVLHDVSLKCREEQITIIVGQAETGKTSLLNILAGKELPTKGSFSINGLDISAEMTREILGILPPRCNLYNELSVEQNLKIFAAIKGIALPQLNYEAQQVLNKLKLSSRKTEVVSNLSYSDKRKLSLGIAFVGGSKVLLLDEPTYGMDAEAKRQVWEALLAIKHDRTVIVTTQSFEEADILGDRIAVMAEGEIKISGTPAFIKQKLGNGYHLHILKDVNFNFQCLESLLRKHVSKVTCESEDHKGVSFNLGTSSELEGLFEELDSRKTDLGIVSYGVSLTTIRDVLLTVSNLSNTKHLVDGDETKNRSTETEDVSKHSFHTAKHANLNNQFQALLLKHFHFCKRRWKSHIIQLTTPFILMLICFYYIEASMKSQSRPLKLDISSEYGSTHGFYFNNDSTISNLAETFKNVLELNDVSVKKVSEPTHYVLNYGKNDLASYLKRLVVGGAFDRLPSGSLNLTAWHNMGSLHSMPMSLLLMQTALLRHVTNTGSISLEIVPIGTLKEKYNSFDSSSPGLVWIFLTFAFTFLSLSFILAPTHERKSKKLQLMSGVPAAVYWIVFFLWDFLIYFVVCIFLIMVPAFFFPSVFFGVHSEAIGALLVLLFLYGWTSFPLGYIVSILLKRKNRGLTIFVGFCILSSMGSAVVLEYISYYLHLRNEEKPYVIKDAIWFSRLFPLYSISKGVLHSFEIAFHNAACDIFTTADLARCRRVSVSSSPTLFGCCKNVCGKTIYFRTCHETWNHLSLKQHEAYFSNGFEALFLGLEGFIFFAILFLLESKTAIKFWNILKILLKSIWNKITRIVLRREQQIFRDENVIDDPQVLQQEEGLLNLTATHQGSGDEALAALGLIKNCGIFFANKCLTFGINKSNCLGILGNKGAGKTSIFRMLMGDCLPFEGNSFTQSYSLIGNFRKFSSCVGYCPEVDSLMDDLTGREMLLLFGKLRGLLGHDLQGEVSDLVQSMGLATCCDDLTQVYSEGDKRRLSVALAVVGSPPVILLDEPTAGVGPESRRQIWKVLNRVRMRTGAAILLATQSTEEFEAFCDRLAIMENGTFRYLGAAEHIKSKHGQAYMLSIKVSKRHHRNVEKGNALRNHIRRSLKNVILIDDYQGKLQYQVKDPSISVGYLFTFMLEVKAQFEVEDYSIGAISLENILECS